jgi:drug/metabolite transporter (DMT)-like permease
MTRTSALLEGILCAVGAGLLWGLVFVTPVLLPDYSPAALSLGRYLAFGMVAVALAWPIRALLRALNAAQWRTALALALIGNLVYYFALAAGIQAAGAPLASVIIGTLPVVIAIVANRTASQHAEQSLPWRVLAPSMALIAVGIALVNRDEMRQMGLLTVNMMLVLGLSANLVAVAAWTWYPIRNARFMKAHPTVSSHAWATAQGLATLPLALLGLAIYACVKWVQAPDGGLMVALVGPRPWHYLMLMITIAIGASWIGTLLWNRASRLLPTALAGQLIVFETMAALAYAYGLRGAWPAPTSVLGIALLLMGVLAAVRAFQRTP